MELFTTDGDRLSLLQETVAKPDLEFEAPEFLAGTSAEELSPEQRHRYIINYIGTKQEVVNWLWMHTPDRLESTVDALVASAILSYSYKTNGLWVLTNDRLRLCRHTAWPIIVKDKVRFSDEGLEAPLADQAKVGIFFAKGGHGLTDTIRFNIDETLGFKKDSALRALAF